GQHLTDEENRQPSSALAHHLPECYLEVGTVESLHTADLLNILARLLLHHSGHIRTAYDSEHVTFAVEHGNRKQPPPDHQLRNLLLIGVLVNERVVHAHH